MITIESKINVLNAPNQSIDSGTINTTKSNISAEIDRVLGQKAQCSNPFIFGASILGNGATFSDNIDYFIGGVPANDNGQFPSAYEITISGSNINSINIAFDTENNRYPNIITIDGIEYANNKSLFIAVDLTESNTHTISFSDWNTPKYPAVISGIYIGLSIKINNLNIIDLTANLISVTDNKYPQYGIMSNVGSIRFNDLTQQVKQLINADLLQQGVDVNIDVIDTISGKKRSVAKYLTKNWNYDSNNHEVSVTLQDNLLQWQEIPFNLYRYITNTYKNGDDLYNELINVTPNKYKIVKKFRANDYLSKIRLSTVQFGCDTLWSAWDMFCKMTGAIMYKDNNGDIIYYGTLNE